MNKAEKAALEAYPNILFPFTPLDLNAYRREAFIAGYDQAEKDLALTWEDIQIIWMETERYMKELRQIEQTDLSTFPSSSGEIFEEVLRRFNEYKSKKNESE